MRSPLGRFSKLDGRKLFWATYALMLAAAIVLGGVGGMMFGYFLDLPRVGELGDVRPGTVTEILTRDGRVIGRLAIEKRILLTYPEIEGSRLMESVLAIEDADFFEHSGIDFRRVFATILNNLLNWERKGASTLTMQLSKLRFTSYERTYERKIKDMFHALEIERRYSKQQILTFYFNQVYMGHGIYGMGAAADFLFSKKIGDLSWSEAATLAGMIRWPVRYSPINSLERAAQRRNVVLRRLLDEGILSQAELIQVSAEPVLPNVRRQDPGIAPYAVESIRQFLAERGYDSDEIWSSGLRIHTTLDYEMQKAAREALRSGLKAFDKGKDPYTGKRRRPWSRAGLNILEKGKALEEYSHPDWRQIFYPGQMVHGLVLESDQEKATVKLGSYTAEIGLEQVQWTGVKKVDQALKKGDVAVFQLVEINRTEKAIKAELDRIPEVQGAFLVLDNRSGSIRAMVGGFDYQYSEFNRATQALRQPGSIFKPFTYVAALEEGYSPLDTELDEPVQFLDGLGRVYEPSNSDGKFKGLLTLYQALGESRNVPTLRLANKLGIERVIASAGKFGIDRDFLPVLPMAIGAGELTLQEITSAFTVFANHGFRAQPHLVERVVEYDQTLREEFHYRVEESVTSEVADQMLFFLRGVVSQPLGTARRARRLGRPMGGKTGTTNDYTDSWFVGFTPQITAGVWVGHDAKKTLGERVYGASLALPIWIDFFEKVSESIPSQDFETDFSLDTREIVFAQPLPDEDAVGPPAPAKPERPKKGMQVEDIPPPPSGGRRHD